MRKAWELEICLTDFSNVKFQIEYNGKLYDVEIIDTAGQEEYSSFRDSSVATGDAFLVLFAINSTSSWHELKDLRSKIIQDRQQISSIPMVIVANKLVSSIAQLHISVMISLLYLNNRGLLLRNYRLIVEPQKFDVFKTNVLVFGTSNFQGTTIRPNVQRHEHSVA